MDKYFTTLLLLVIFSFELKADEPRYNTQFFNSDSSFILSISTDSTWVLKSKKNEVIYFVRDNKFASKTVLISKDGNYIVLLNDHPWTDSPLSYNKDRISVSFYFKGEMFQYYKFSDLIADECNISFSVSHFNWLVRRDGFSFKNDSLSLTTSEFNDFSFDIHSGKYSKRPTFNYGDNVIVIYGSFIKTKTNNLSIKVWKCLYPKTGCEKIVYCESKRFGMEGKWVSFFVIKDGKDITQYRFWNEIYNNCLMTSEY